MNCRHTTQRSLNALVAVCVAEKNLVYGEHSSMFFSKPKVILMFQILYPSLKASQNPLHEDQKFSLGSSIRSARFRLFVVCVGPELFVGLL